MCCCRQVVTVTATLDDAGVGWPATMPPGWTETNSTTATYKPVLLQAAPCFPVLPTDPVVTQATCTAGEVTVPTIELASTPAGVTYVADPAGPYVADDGDAGDGDGDVVRRVEVGHDDSAVDVCRRRRRRRSR